MKRSLVINFFVIATLATMCFSCGIIYTNIRTPMPHVAAPTVATTFSKVGTATCTSYVGLVALGDCSVNKAMENGGLTKIHHVDTKIKSLLCGIYETITLVVYGE